MEYPSELFWALKNRLLGYSMNHLIFHGQLRKTPQPVGSVYALSSDPATQLSVKPTTCLPDWRLNGLPKFFKDQGGIEEVRRKATTGKAKTMKDKVELGRAVLDSEALAFISSDSLNASFSNQSLEEGVVLLATREDDGSFAVRRVVQSNSAVKSALAACSSVGEEKEKAKQLQDENRAIEEERMAAQAALKAA
jgi:hypothetical protein